MPTFRAQGQGQIDDRTFLMGGNQRRPNPVPLVRRLGQALVDVATWAVALVAVFLLLHRHHDVRFSTVDRLVVAGVVLATALPTALALGLYQGRFWYGSARESIRLYASMVAAVLAGSIAALALGTGGNGVETTLLAAPVAATLSHLARIVLWLRRRRVAPTGDGTGRRVIIFGAGDGGALVVRSLLKSPAAAFVPVAILDDDPSKGRLEIEHIPVLGDRSAIPRVAVSTNADALLIATPSAESSTIRELTSLGRAAGLEVLALPGVDELFGAISPGDIRPVSEQDLLGRHPVDIDIEAIAAFLTGRRVLITGAGGSIGSELCRQVHRFAPRSLHLLDYDDSGLHAVELSLEGRALLDDDRLVLADIRDPEAINAVFARVKPEVVFHAAALKHLTLLERFPDEAWKTNVLGTQNLLDAALANGVEHFVNISTDKAADPTSVLGWSKRITERQTSHAAAQGRHFVSVRFGNVLGSRGSVLEIFEAQIRDGGPITVTHPEVTRYFMTVAEAVRLTMNAAAVGSAGEVLVLDMGEPVRIVEIAKRLSAASPRPIRIEYTGLRPGEKLHEHLLGASEQATQPAHPKISHVVVPPLDLARLARNGGFPMTAAQLQVIAASPSGTVPTNERRGPTNER